MIITLNAGHTISGPGSGAVGFINESQATREVANALQRKLEGRGHKVIRCDNDYASTTGENLSAIVNSANSVKSDLFISIHFNAGGGTGSEIYTYKGTKHREATSILKSLNAQLGLKNRGVKDGSNLYVIRNTTTKAILIECCFVDNIDDFNMLKAHSYDDIAEAIADGITPDVSTVCDYVRTLQDAGIIGSPEIWLNKGKADSNVFHLLRKTAEYIRR